MRHIRFLRFRANVLSRTRSSMQDFKNLEVWNKAHNLTLVLYKATSRFPKEELFGLTSQIRRCSASIGANIAEGTGRTGHAELHRFFRSLVALQPSWNI